MPQVATSTKENVSQLSQEDAGGGPRGNTGLAPSGLWSCRNGGGLEGDPALLDSVPGRQGLRPL